MKLIAHRGGTFGKENSLENMLCSAKAGADAIECDIRRTKDGVLVIYHDPDLKRLTGIQAKITEITYPEMQRILSQADERILTFEDLKKGYREKTPILLHIKLTEYDADFAKHVALSGLPIIAGVMSIDMLKCFSRYLPKERILAFLPKAGDAKEFYENGAGILRLWEQWLPSIKPGDLKKLCPAALIYIMACNLKVEPWRDIPIESMDGSRESLEKCHMLGADGVILNRIDMALDWRKNYK